MGSHIKQWCAHAYEVLSTYNRHCWRTRGNGKIVLTFHVFSNFTPPSQQIPVQKCQNTVSLSSSYIMFAALLLPQIHCLLEQTNSYM